VVDVPNVLSHAIESSVYDGISVMCSVAGCVRGNDNSKQAKKPAVVHHLPSCVFVPLLLLLLLLVVAVA